MMLRCEQSTAGAAPSDEREARVLLAVHVEPGDRLVRSEVERDGVRQAWASYALRRNLRSGREMSAQRHLEAAQEVGLRIVVPGDAEWPEQLGALGSDAPFALWVSGAANLRLALVRSIAIVGARAATPYGLRVAHEWAVEAGDARAGVVSGAAIGIDGAAHRGALSVEAMTVAVLAGGADVAYPRAHEQLLARIADEGLVVSESPPGARPLRHRFLTRNRLIAALSAATVIVEAAHRSGTIATAHAAARIGREVFAVPGPVTSPMSDGCHRLIADGIARIARSAPDVLDCLLPLGEQATAAAVRDADRDEQSRRSTDELTSDELAVYDAMPRRGVASEDELMARCAVSTAVILACLGSLEAKGMVRRGDAGWSRRA